jgi:hypothetical protein
MDPSMNHRHAQDHSADLHRRAELHRLAASGREAKREASPERPARRRVPSLAAGLAWIIGRVAPRRV